MVSFTPRTSLPAARKEYPIHSRYGLLKKRNIPYFYRGSSTVLSLGLKIKLLLLFSIYYLLSFFKFLSLFLFSLHFLFFTYFSPSLYFLALFLFRILHHFAI